MKPYFQANRRIRSKNTKLRIRNYARARVNPTWPDSPQERWDSDVLSSMRAFGVVTVAMALLLSGFPLAHANSITSSESRDPFTQEIESTQQQIEGLAPAQDQRVESLPLPESDIDARTNAVATRIGELPAEGEFVPGEVIVTFDTDATKRQKKGVRVEAAGGLATEASKQPDEISSDVELIQLGRKVSVKSAIAELQDNPAVVAVEPNYILRTSNTPNDPSFLDGTLWGMYGGQTSPSNPYGA